MNNKNREIERKFLVQEKNLPNLTKMNYMDIVQGYFTDFHSEYIYRLRQVLFKSHEGDMMGEDYYQTIKGTGTKERDEYDKRIWRDTFSAFWPLCRDISLHKNRYEMKSGDALIQLDIYKNGLEGLFTVEVEFQNIEDCDSYIPPEWFGEEVTEDVRYSNLQLAVNGIPK